MDLDWTAVGERLGLNLEQGVAVVISAVGIYLVFLLLVRLFGQRVLSGLGTFDIVVTVMLGAVAGRVILGHPPTLAAGALGLFTLFLLEATFGHIRGTLRGARLLTSEPVVLMIGERELPEAMRRTHVTDLELHTALRRAGIRNRSEVACVIMEPTGALSVLRRGIAIDPDLLRGVRHADLIPQELVDGDHDRP